MFSSLPSHLSRIGGVPVLWHETLDIQLAIVNEVEILFVEGREVISSQPRDEFHTFARLSIPDAKAKMAGVGKRRDLPKSEVICNTPAFFTT